MNKKAMLLIACVFAVITLWADDLPPTISYLPVLNSPMYGSPQRVEASILDDTTYNSPISLTELYYSLDNASFTMLPMALAAAGKYAADIPAHPLGTQIWYYIKAADSANNIATTATNSFFYEDPAWRRYVPVSGNYRRYGGTSYMALNVFANPMYGSGYTLKLDAVEGRLYSAATAQVYVYECTSATPSMANISQVLGPVEVVFTSRQTIITDVSAYGVEIDSPYFCVGYEIPGDIYYAVNPNYFWNHSYAILNGTSMTNSSGYGTWNIAARIRMGSSQNPPIGESFEATLFPPANWKSVNNGDPNQWARSTEAPYTGLANAVMDAPWPPDIDHDDWLITPRLRPTAADHTFSFRARRWSLAIFERFNVKLSTASNQPADFTTTLAANINPPVSYNLYTYDLSAYIGQDVYLAIHTTSNQGWRLFVDDVGGIPPAPVFTAPNAPSGLLPADLASGVYLNGTLSWSLNGGGLTGVKLYLDTVNPPAQVYDLGIAGTYTPPALLSPNTTYFWKVAAYNAFGETASGVQSFTTRYTALYPPSYASTGDYPDIGQVSIGNWANPATEPTEYYGNPTAVNTYTDYTSLPALPLRAGNSYPIGMIMISSNYGMMSCDTSIYIDYNRNGAYELPDELFYSGTMGEYENPVFGTSQFIPPTATQGYTGMRVVLKNMDGMPIQPAGVYDYGETEDYVVNILPPAAPEPVLLTYPEDGATNISVHGFNLRWSPVEAGGTPTSYTVYMAANPADIYSSHVWTTTNTHFNPRTEGGLTLAYLDTWYWTVKAHNAMGEATVIPPHSFQIMGDNTVELPYEAEFSSPELPLGWSQTASGGLTSERWAYNYGMWMCFGGDATGTARLISPPINTAGISDLAVTFATFFYPYGPGITYKLQYSHDYVNWTDMHWSITNEDFYSFMTDAVIGISAPRTYLAWTLEGSFLDMEAAGMFQVLVHEFVPPVITMDSAGMITWGSANVPSYKVMASDTPDGAYTQVEHTAETSWQIPFGSPQKFFHVVSSTDILQPITSLPALPVIDRGRWKGRGSGRPMER